jgi:hypothetical protein
VLKLADRYWKLRALVTPSTTTTNDSATATPGLSTPVRGAASSSLPFGALHLQRVLHARILLLALKLRLKLLPLFESSMNAISWPHLSHNARGQSLFAPARRGAALAHFKALFESLVLLQLAVEEVAKDGVIHGITPPSSTISSLPLTLSSETKTNHGERAPSPKFDQSSPLSVLAEEGKGEVSSRIDAKSPLSPSSTLTNTSSSTAAASDVEETPPRPMLWALQVRACGNLCLLPLIIRSYLLCLID